jgi:site-specific DNA-methyltransferase (adenine-specific)
MLSQQIKNGVFYLGDCFEVMKEAPDNCVDMILCDLPYGTTACKWDTILPLKELWEQYWRIAKPNAAIVLTAAQPFTSALVVSSLENFKYDWCWRKPKGTGHLNAKKMPMRDKEDILIFYKSQPIYNPQLGEGEPYGNKAGKNIETGLSDNYGKFGTHREGSDGKRYPKQVLFFPVVERGTIHPTQKPVALFEYLIRTYTNEGDLVLDNCAGSGTTAIACENTNRKWVCIEKDETYANAAIERIRNHAPKLD